MSVATNSTSDIFSELSLLRKKLNQKEDSSIELGLKDFYKNLAGENFTIIKDISRFNTLIIFFYRTRFDTHRVGVVQTKQTRELS